MLKALGQIFEHLVQIVLFPVWQNTFAFQFPIYKVGIMLFYCFTEVVSSWSLCECQYGPVQWKCDFKLCKTVGYLMFWLSGPSSITIFCGFKLFFPILPFIIWGKCCFLTSSGSCINKLFTVLPKMCCKDGNYFSHVNSTPSFAKTVLLLFLLLLLIKLLPCFLYMKKSTQASNVTISQFSDVQIRLQHHERWGMTKWWLQSDLGRNSVKILS